jgi:hypothetical protein
VLPRHGPARWLLIACYLPLLAWAPLLAAVTAAYWRRRTRAADAADAGAERRCVLRPNPGDPRSPRAGTQAR